MRQAEMHKVRHCRFLRPPSQVIVGVAIAIMLGGAGLKPASAQSAPQNFVATEWNRFLQECGPYFTLTQVDYKNLLDTISGTYQTTEDGSLLHWVSEDPSLSLWKAVQISYGPSGYQIDCEMNQFRSPTAAPAEIGRALEAMVGQSPELNLVGGRQITKSAANIESVNGIHYSVFGAIPGLPYPVDINVTDDVFSFYAAAFIAERE